MRPRVVPPGRGRIGKKLDADEDSEALAMFHSLVRLLPLRDGSDIKKFEMKLGKFQSKLNLLSIATVRDESDRPLIWYAAENDDPIAAELLLSLGAASTAFSPTASGRTPYQHAMDRGNLKVLTVFRAYAPRRSDGLSEDLDDLLATSPQATRSNNCCPDSFSASHCTFSCEAICGEEKDQKHEIPPSEDEMEQHAAIAVARSSSFGKRIGKGASSISHVP